MSVDNAPAVLAEMEERERNDDENVCEISYLSRIFEDEGTTKAFATRRMEAKTNIVTNRNCSFHLLADTDDSVDGISPTDFCFDYAPSSIEKISNEKKMM